MYLKNKRFSSLLLFLFSILISSSNFIGNDSIGKFQVISQYFTGNWDGKGKFSNGKPIEASIVIEIDSISNAIICKHYDKAPSTWKNMSVWNISKSDNNIVALFNDKFSGARIFISNDWDTNHIIFNREYTISNIKRYERFSYFVIDQNTFKMIWEKSSDAVNWTLGDFLIFNKVLSNN